MSTPTNTSPSQSPALNQLPPELPVQPIGGPIDVDIAVPGSKSITNRYLVMAALASGNVHLTGLLHSDDTVFMIDCLRTLGYAVRENWTSSTCMIEGRGGEIPARGAELYVGAGGTLMRFMSAFVSLGQGRFRLDGVPRMRERPIEDLLQGMRGIGVNARSELNNGCPPVIVEANGLPGGAVSIDGSRSSQYISAMLLIAPYAKARMPVTVTGNFVSRPYVELTLRCMSDFGVGTATEGERSYVPTHGVKYRPGAYDVEGDASNASYFLAAAAILGGRCCITNVRADSPQGDAAFADVLRRMGCRVRQGFLPGKRGIEISRDPKTPLKAVDADLNDMPDVVMTLAALCLFADGPSLIENVGNLRIKETDRLAAIAAELRRLGATVEEGPDSLEITPGPAKNALIETYDDHRMAMSMALVGLARPGVTIKNPSCVSKSYPRFFTDLEKLRKS